MPSGAGNTGNPQRPCVGSTATRAGSGNIGGARHSVRPPCPRPYDLGRIDIGVVIDPFLMDVMVW
jgi:hypothetical protein